MDVLIQTEHLLVAVRWDFHFFTIPRHSGERAIRPREGLSTPPARRAGHRRCSYAGITEGCCVGRAWRQPETAGRRVELGSRICILGMYVIKIFSKIHLGITTTIPLPRSNI